MAEATGVSDSVAVKVKDVELGGGGGGGGGGTAAALPPTAGWERGKNTKNKAGWAGSNTNHQPPTTNIL